MLNKAQIIDAITQVNQSARPGWLDTFDAAALKQYLDHLQLTLEPRGLHSSWIRPGGTRAVVTRAPAA